jgi:cell division protein FtsW (lipid II flippase)
MRYIINAALFIFLCYSLFLIYFSIYEIQTKGVHPEVKHASNELLNYLAALAVALVVIDYFILRKFYRDIKKYGLF